MVIGLTGTNGAGKTAVCDYLKTRGFEYYSLSDEIRAELARQGAPPTRQNLIDAGNRLRQDFGAGVLAERIKSRLEPGVAGKTNSVDVQPCRALQLYKRSFVSPIWRLSPTHAERSRVTRRSESDRSVAPAIR